MSVCKSQLPIALGSHARLWENENLFGLIGRSLAVLWDYWSETMELASIWGDGQGFSLRGQCPHCHHHVAFMTVTNPYIEESTVLDSRMIAAARCTACNGYILAILKTVRVTSQSSKYVYECHYPLGAPDDSIADGIPESIAGDFKEALRCHWVKAWKATVLMCRRSLQVSCDLEGAVGNDLFNQIDDLEQKQRITETLKKMAHRIRLLGKKGAHGDYSDIDDTITPKDAEDAITFVRHYFEHIYVLPKKLGP